MNKLLTKSSTKKGITSALLLLTVGLLAACGGVDNNSTALSRDFSPAPAVTAIPPTNAAPSPTVPGGASPAPGGGGSPTAGGGAASPAPGGGGGTAAAGLRVFNGNACGTCHLQGGKVAGIGPKLQGTARDDAYIGNIIRKGMGTMPAYSAAQVSDAQIQDLIAYIRSL